MLSAHMMNLMIAVKVQNLTGEGDGCVWYMMNFLLDFAIGMTLSLVFLNLLNKHIFKDEFHVSHLISMTSIVLEKRRLQHACEPLDSVCSLARSADSVHPMH
jgi:hypothetical protein